MKDCIRCGEPFEPRTTKKYCDRCRFDKFKDPEWQIKRRAGHLTKKAIKHGILTRQPCEKCGKTEVDGHHDDYSKPLEVRWLCRWCHQSHHAEVNRLRKQVLKEAP